VRTDACAVQATEQLLEHGWVVIHAREQNRLVQDLNAGIVESLRRPKKGGTDLGWVVGVNHDAQGKSRL
jgi:hypothetical protein